MNSSVGILVGILGVVEKLMLICFDSQYLTTRTH